MLSHQQIRVIYDEGIEAVGATIHQLYEMIETDEERVQKLIALATSMHLKKIEQLISRINRLEEELSKRVGQLYQLNRAVRELNRQLKEAWRQTHLAREAHLATVMKNSQTSSLPPSTEPHKRTRSLREKSGKKPGGQVGHKGMTREMIEQTDHLIIHAPETCSLCGTSLSECQVEASERRQVHDLPPQKIEVTEHHVQTKVCSRCGMKNKAKFPKGVSAPVQYGAGVRSVVAYLMGYQLLPYERCAEMMDDLFTSHLSAGTLATILQRVCPRSDRTLAAH